MWTLEIPGCKNLEINFLVLDYNGTLGIDGKLIPGVKERLISLSENIEIHIVTADTFGRAAQELEGIPVSLKILDTENQAVAKQNHVQNLDPKHVIAMGNGRNDRLMLKEAALGIALIQEEGTSTESIHSADLVCKSITDALDLLKNPNRLVASLRD